MLIRIDEESHAGSASNHGEIYKIPGARYEGPENDAEYSTRTRSYLRCSIEGVLLSARVLT